jgi:hypothetical protein
VKKTSAAIAVTTIGVVSVAAGAAAPAAADPVTTPCADLSEHVLADPLPDNWYMPCVPQYGIGKAEFTIESTTDFPAEFIALDEPGVTTTSAVDETVIGAYLNGGPLPMIQPEDLDTASQTPTSQTYAALIVAPVTGVDVVAPIDLPADVATQCNLPGWTTPIYRASYGPASTTFSQTIDGVPWNFTVTGNPPPTYFFLQFDPTAVTGFPIDVPPVLGGSDFCVTDGTHTIAGIADSTGIDSQVIASVYAGFVPPFSMLIPVDLLDPDLDIPLPDLGTFALTAADPQLASTGLDATPYLAAAGALGGVGVLLAFLGYRRRRAARHAAE